MRELFQRIGEFARGKRLDRDLDDEAAFHLAMLEQEFRTRGLSAAQAQAAARREFGGVAQTKEAYRRERGLPWLELLAKDVRYAFRGLKRSPGFTAAAVFSLALGIGANTAVFSLFHALMLRMLPVSHPEQLVTLYRTGGWGEGFSSYPLFLEFRKRTDLFRDVLARNGVEKVRFGERAGARVEFAGREFVSGNYFNMLGIAPAHGRLFTDDDNRVPQGHPLAVLSYDFWRNRFGADPQITGRTIVVDEHALTVIGVAAAGFRGVQPSARTDVWVPAMMRDGRMDEGNHWLWIIARRRPEVTPRRIQQAADALLRHHLAAFYGSEADTAFRKMAMNQCIEVRAGGAGLSQLRDQFGKPLTVLMAAVFLVLLTACANVANLLLARGAARTREIALRVGIGAPRARLVRQALTESLSLAAAGGTLGVLLALSGTSYVVRFLPVGTGDPLDASPDVAVLAFTLAASVFSAILFGLAPALRSTAVDPVLGLRGQTGPGARPTLQRALVVAQVAFSVVLVALAGLFAHSLAQLRSIDPGFRNQGTIAFQLNFPRNWKEAQSAAVRERLVQTLEHLPGVSSVSYAIPGPFRAGMSTATVEIPGPDGAAKEPVSTAMHAIAPRYFETIGSALLAGREFNASDTATSPRVAVINQAFLRQFLPGEAHPLSRTLRRGKELIAIVGVAPDIHHLGLRENTEPVVYRPFPQSAYWAEPSILVRAQMPPATLLPAIRKQLASVGSDVAIEDPRTIQQDVDESIFQDRLLAALGRLFGALALLLAGIGHYGVVAYATSRRASEIGIRMALGAEKTEVLRMVLRDAMMLVATGLAVGLPCSLAAGRAVSSVLFGIKPADPVALVTTVGALLTAGLAAAFVPARRAASMDPMRALRHE